MPIRTKDKSDQVVDTSAPAQDNAIDVSQEGFKDPVLDEIRLAKALGL